MKSNNDTSIMRRGCIYKIISDKTDKIYIGSTTQLLPIRLQQHFNSYHSYINGYSNTYISSFEIIKLAGNIQIILLESVSYNKLTKLELLTREGEYILMPQFSNVIVNINNPTPINYKPIKPDINTITNYFFNHS